MIRRNRWTRFFRQTVLLAVLAGLFWGPSVAAQTLATPGILYASTGNKDGGRLLTINVATGVGTLIAATGVSAISGLAIDPQGRIYGSDPLDPSNLYRIDAATGSATLIGNTGVRGMDGIAFGPGGVLYGLESFGEANLYRLNVNTAAATLIGPLTGLPGDEDMVGMAFDPTTGTMFASTGEVDKVYRVNLSTGAVTLVGSTGLGGSIPDLAVDSNGNLYGSNGNEGSTNFTLISINKSTGAGTTIGLTGFSSVSGLAIFNPVQVAVPAPVPAMDVGGVAALALVLGALGLALLRKR